MLDVLSSYLRIDQMHLSVCMSLLVLARYVSKCGNVFLCPTTTLGSLEMMDTLHIRGYSHRLQLGGYRVRVRGGVQALQVKVKDMGQG